MSVVTNSETHMLLVGPGSPSEVSLVVGNFPSPFILVYLHSGK